ncbi:MAG: flagellar biosynthesis protein FlgA [Proteobacteria bacterium]|nr:flagellar biosynthesis protein FlgA [Pseudomonadota bacterium]
MLWVFFTFLCLNASAARIKDIADIYGVRDNAIFGYGLVTGLKRTGDTIRNEATIRTLSKRLQGLGVTLTVDQIMSRNVAVVMVTARLPVTSRPGQRLDVEVSSAGDALSLEGGVLQLTPLMGADGEPYALAQGPLVIGGYSVEQSGTVNRKNHTTTGRVPQGATVERENPNKIVLQEQEQINYLLRKPDFTTALRIVEAINGELGGEQAAAVDNGAVAVQIPQEFKGNVVALLASIENIDIEIDTPAKVVINERTGTVVMGAGVRITPVAVAHGGLSIAVNNEPMVSQPNPFGEGQTIRNEQASVEAEESEGKLQLVGGATIGELVDALNQLGVNPRDLVQILVTIKAAGALHAELEVL